MLLHDLLGESRSSTIGSLSHMAILDINVLLVIVVLPMVVEIAGMWHH